jgi:hypothetical protein
MTEVKSKNESQVIRLSKDHTRRLGVVAERINTPQAQLVKWALDALLAEVEANGGKLTLPIQFKVGDSDIDPRDPAPNP